MKRKVFPTATVTVFCLLISLLFIVPFYWMLVSSFKPSGEIFADSLSLLPKNPTLANYIGLLSKGFPRWYLNSVIFCLGYVGLGVLVNSAGGFVFAKYDFRFKNVLFLCVVLAQMLPIHMQLIPLFIMLSKFGVLNTYHGLIIPMLADPIALFFMRQNMMSIQDDLLNVARIDGASEFQLYYRIALPLSKPALAAVSVLLALFAWNDLLWPLIVMRTNDMFTLTVGLSTLVGSYRPQWGLLMAGSTAAMIPVLAFFFRMQDGFISGLTAGSIKG